ncbi:trypsin-1-like [Cloeon dipterum]|uniref:trypsin-1-like n=1 Tax=Cloeon dipterum TaxID=197152 RepID=UPI00321FDEEB
MSPLQWLLCFALLAQVCAMGKNFGISGKLKLVDTKSPDEERDSEANFSYNETETQPFLKEVLRNQNDSDKDTGMASKNEKPSSDGNQARVNVEPRSNLNYTQRRARLLGGTDVALGINVQFFYNVLVEGVSILGTQNKYCGGAILSKSWVLTAAQCVVGVDPVRVYAGSAIDPLNTVTPIDAVFRYPHEKFVRNTLLNDIALIKLVKPLALGGTISTIRLSTVSIHTLGGVSFRTYGWGPPDDSTTLPVPPILKFIKMKNLKKI